jgi:hypothetical protein
VGTHSASQPTPFPPPRPVRLSVHRHSLRPAGPCPRVPRRRLQRPLGHLRPLCPSVVATGTDGTVTENHWPGGHARGPQWPRRREFDFCDFFKKEGNREEEEKPKMSENPGRHPRPKTQFSRVPCVRVRVDGVSTPGDGVTSRRRLDEHRDVDRSPSTRAPAGPPAPRPPRGPPGPDSALAARVHELGAVVSVSRSPRWNVSPCWSSGVEGTGWPAWRVTQDLCWADTPFQ